MAKEYRNAARSKRMIKSALIDLLAKKELSKITVVEVVETADISRNTFYAHYQNVYAIIKEIRDDCLQKLTGYLDEAFENNEIDNPLPLLLNITAFLQKDIETNRILISREGSEEFLEKVKTILVERTLAAVNTAGIKDTHGFQVFMELMAGGAVDLFRKCILGRTDVPLEETARQVNRILIAGTALYK